MKVREVQKFSQGPVKLKISADVRNTSTSERSKRSAANEGKAHTTNRKHVRGTETGPRGEVISTRETRPPVEESVFARSSRGTASAAVAPPYTHTHTYRHTHMHTAMYTGRGGRTG